MDVFLLEAEPYDPGIASTTVVRFSSGGSRNYYNGDVYPPRLTVSIDYNSEIFPENLPGATSAASGNLVIANPDGEYDYLLDYNWDGRTITVKHSDTDVEDYSSFSTVFKGMSKGITVGESEIAIVLRDNSELLKQPIQPNKYLGTGAEEGTVDIKNKSKPLMWGTCYNLEPVLVDGVKLIYQLNDGVLTSVLGVFDKGIVITASVDYPTYTDLAAVTAASIPGGVYLTCLAEGFIRLGAPAYGLLTCDATGFPLYTITDIVKDILLDNTRGNLTLADLDEDSFDKFAVETNWPNGYFLEDSNAVVNQVIEELVASVFGCWFYSEQGLITVRRFTFGTLTETISKEDIQTVQRLETGLPNWSSKVSYKRVWRVHGREEIAFTDLGIEVPVVVYRRYPVEPPTPTGNDVPSFWTSTYPGYTTYSLVPYGTDENLYKAFGPVWSSSATQVKGETQGEWSTPVITDSNYKGWSIFTTSPDIGCYASTDGVKLEGVPDENLLELSEAMWRIRSLGTYGGVGWGAATIEFRETAGGSDVAALGAPEYSDQQGVETASKAFDGDGTTNWRSNSELGWIGARYYSPPAGFRAVREVRIVDYNTTTGETATARRLKGFVVEYSNGNPDDWAEFWRVENISPTGPTDNVYTKEGADTNQPFIDQAFYIDKKITGPFRLSFKVRKSTDRFMVGLCSYLNLEGYDTNTYDDYAIEAPDVSEGVFVAQEDRWIIRRDRNPYSSTYMPATGIYPFGYYDPSSNLIDEHAAKVGNVSTDEQQFNLVSSGDSLDIWVGEELVRTIYMDPDEGYTRSPVIIPMSEGCEIYDIDWVQGVYSNLLPYRSSYYTATARRMLDKVGWEVNTPLITEGYGVFEFDGPPPSPGGGRFTARLGIVNPPYDYTSSAMILYSTSFPYDLGAIQVLGTGIYRVYIGGEGIVLTGVHSHGDKYDIDYTGKRIRFYKNGVLIKKKKISSGHSTYPYLYLGAGGSIWDYDWTLNIAEDDVVRATATDNSFLSPILDSSPTVTGSYIILAQTNEISIIRDEDDLGTLTLSGAFYYDMLSGTSSAFLPTILCQYSDDGGSTWTAITLTYVAQVLASTIADAGQTASFTGTMPPIYTGNIIVRFTAKNTNAGTYSVGSNGTLNLQWIN